jgi:hypothetical protein
LNHASAAELTESSPPVVSSVRASDFAVKIPPDPSEIADKKRVVDVAASKSTVVCKPPLGRLNATSPSLTAKSVLGIDTSRTTGSANPGSFDCAADFHEKVFISAEIPNSSTSESSTPVVSELEKSVSGVMHITGNSSVLDCKPDPLLKSVGPLLSKSYPDVARLIEQGKFPKNLGKYAHQKRSEEIASSDFKVGLLNLDDLEKAAVEYLLQLGNASPIAPTWVLPEIKKKIVKFPPLTLLGIGSKSCSISEVRQVKIHSFLLIIISYQFSE